MEEQKLLRKKKKALNGSNRKQLAEVCSELGDYYNGKVKYEEALQQYLESANIYQELQMQLENAKAHRMIGEMFMLLAEFEKALMHEDIYLSVARELNDQVEEQRALATLGRAFLLQGQSLSNPEESKKSLKAAEKAFMKSLLLCESLKGKVNSRELMDMRARLLLNIGVVLEHIGSFDRAVEFIQKAIAICKSQDLFDLLSQCYITEGILHSLRKSDNAKAILCFNFALDIASRLENKVAKQCEALSLKAGALCKLSDFHSAKSILKKACKMKTPDVSEREEIERKLKIVAAICYTEDLLVITDSSDHEAMKKLYEKFGDGACSLKNYQKGIECYHKMLEHAEKNGDTGKKLVPIYISLYQTYKDMKDYEKALEYQRKEFDIVKDDHNEAFTTLLSIAETLQLAGEPCDEIESVYHAAREQARKICNDKKEVKVLKLLLKFFKQLGADEKVKEFESELSLMGLMCDVSLSEDSSDGDDSDECHDTPNIGDDICLEDLTDISEDESEETDKPRVVRKRGKGFTIKKNAKGETQLHQACISGNTLLVTRLLSQGHPVNVRDNAGWLPLHEACIHGKKDIVEMLIKNGAHVNDRGGTQCDGITPMHDAAGNGFLEIVELLLDNGASPSIKNDHGKSVLHILREWKANEVLDATEHIFYETLCARIHKSLEKVGENISSTPITEPNSQNLVHENKSNLQRASRSFNEINRSTKFDESDDDNYSLLGHKAKNRNFIEDDSSNSSTEDIRPVKIPAKGKNNGVREYRNAMESLRNRHNITDTESDQEIFKDKEKRKKGAFLQPDEVGDDWLEDDVQQSHGKKRKNRNSHENECIKRKSKDSVKSPFKSDNRIVKSNVSTPHKATPETDIINSYGFLENLPVANEICDSDSNSMDADLIQRENIPPEVCENNSLNFSGKLSTEDVFKEKNERRKWKRQLTLTRTGFTRQKSERSKANSTSNDGISSDTDSYTNFSLTSKRGTLACSEEPDSTSEQSQQQNIIDRVKGMSQHENVSMQITRPGNLPNFAPSQPSIAPAAVRVRIQDKLLLIPVLLDRVDSLTISWLSKEASRRYYNIEGVQPSLSLLTNDGALLADEDPLSLVIGPLELQANIISWNLPPVGERYIECCGQLKTDVDEYIRSVLESSQATHILPLSSLNLSPSEVQPVFKSLNHQTNLTTLLLPNNFIGNDGLKYLAHCLPTLTQIKCINLSGNCIDAGGLKSLICAFEKPNSIAANNLIDLDLSFNPLGDIGFNYVMNLTTLLRLKGLHLRACDVTLQTSERSIEMMNLKNLEILDISLNKIQKNVLRLILDSVNPYVMTHLKLEGLDISGDFVATVMESFTAIKLKELDLSRCNLTDGDVSQILRSISKCENLEIARFCYNPELTVLSLKKLIQHEPSLVNINLEGCHQIFKYLKESDLQDNWFSEIGISRTKSLKITPGFVVLEEERMIQQFSNMWMNKWDSEAVVERGMYNELHLTVL